MNALSAFVNEEGKSSSMRHNNIFKLLKNIRQTRASSRGDCAVNFRQCFSYIHSAVVGHHTKNRHGFAAINNNSTHLLIPAGSALMR